MAKSGLKKSASVAKAAERTKPAAKGTVTESKVFRDGLIYLYQRADFKKPTWLCRVKVPNGKGYVNRSTGTALDGLLDDDGNPSFTEDDPLLNIAAHVMVAQRSSQNKIVSLFERLRQSNGWDIEKVEKLPKAASDRKWKDAQQDIKERRIQRILAARELDDSEYIELAADRDKGTKLPKADRFAVERYELQKAYNRPVDRRLIEMDNGGALREQIAVFRKIFGDPRFAEPMFDQIADMLKDGKPLINQPIWTLVATMMVAAGLAKNAGLVATKKVRAEDLDRFKKLLTDNRVMIEETLKAPLRVDFAKNPVRQLNIFLGFSGLKLVATKRRQKVGQKNIEYKLDPATVKSMTSFL